MSETVSLFYPEMIVKVGAYEVTKNVSIEICSARSSYYDWCKVKLQPELRSLIGVEKYDNGNIALGYNGQLESVFEGYIVNSSGAAGELLLKDQMLKLERTKITCTFMDAGPVEIIEYCLRQASVLQYKIFSDTFQKKSSVPFRQKTIVQVLEDVKILWGIKELFYFSGGIFYFGQQPMQDKVYTLVHGESIIALAKEGTFWVVETASVPFVHHSDRIKINHPDISAEAKEVVVEKVIFQSNASGFVRTKIYF